MKNSSDQEKILKLLRSSILDVDQQISLAEYRDEDIYVGNDDPVMFFAEKTGVTFQKNVQTLAQLNL